jgi:hypothetical protein
MMFSLLALMWRVRRSQLIARYFVTSFQDEKYVIQHFGWQICHLHGPPVRWRKMNSPMRVNVVPRRLECLKAHIIHQIMSRLYFR